MKKIGFALLGLFLAGMAITCFVGGDPIVIVVGVACAFGAFASFRAVWRLAPTAPEVPRPWES